ncbi:MAG: component of SufBCD complex [Shimia sp.]
MDLISTIFELIDARSFSNLWYWIALAVMWGTLSHWTLGIPFDMLTRAQRDGGEAVQEVEALAFIHAHRLARMDAKSGLWVLGVGSLVLTSLALMAVLYGIEVAQAALLLAAPFAVVWLLTLRLAHRLVAQAVRGEELLNLLARHRLTVQVLAVVSIFVTALFGMYHNLVTDWL